MKRVILVIACLLLAVVGTVSANLVANGDFENSGPIPAQGYLTCPPGVLNDWTIVNSVDVIGGYWQPASGSQSLDLAGNEKGTISQILTTPPGTYDLSFNMSGNPDGAPTTKTVEVFWGGVSQGTFTFNTAGISHSNMGWVKKGITGLVPTGATTELKFVDVSGGTEGTPWGAALDNIDVSSSFIPTPEFPSVALPAAFIVGLIGAILFIQRSKEE
jgi:choice-of-anchor C domain-containing protein